MAETLTGRRSDFRCATELFGEAVRGIADVRGMLRVTEDALAVHAARRALVSTLVSKLDKALAAESRTGTAAAASLLSELGGAERLVSLVKLMVASEHALGTTGSELMDDDDESDSSSGGGGDGAAADSGGGSTAQAGQGAEAALVSGDSERAGAGPGAAASAAASSSSIGGAAGGGGAKKARALVGPLCVLVKRLLRREAERASDGGAGAGTPTAAAAAAAAAAALPGADGGGHSLSTAALSKVLVDDCVANLLQATRPAASSERKVVESIHPYFPVCSYTGIVRFPGATVRPLATRFLRVLFFSFFHCSHHSCSTCCPPTSLLVVVQALRVTFDPRCRISAEHSVLRFQAGGAEDGGALAGMTPEQQAASQHFWRTPLQSCTGEASNFTPFLVHGDTLHYLFVSRGEVSHQGAS